VILPALKSPGIVGLFGPLDAFSISAAFMCSTPVAGIASLLRAVSALVSIAVPLLKPIFGSIGHDIAKAVRHFVLWDGSTGKAT